MRYINDGPVSRQVNVFFLAVSLDGSRQRYYIIMVRILKISFSSLFSVLSSPLYVRARVPFLSSATIVCNSACVAAILAWVWSTGLVHDWLWMFPCRTRAPSAVVCVWWSTVVCRWFSASMTFPQFSRTVSGAFSVVKVRGCYLIFFFVIFSFSSH